MSSLLEKAFETRQSLPADEQDEIASRILAELADEQGWRERFAQKRDVISADGSGSSGRRRAR